MDDLTHNINRFFAKAARADQETFDQAHSKFFGLDLGTAIDQFFALDSALNTAIDEFFAFDLEGKDPVKEGWVGRSGKSGQFTSKGAGEAAIPEPPQIHVGAGAGKSTISSAKGKQQHINKLYEHAKAGEWDIIEAYPTPGTNTHAKALASYKAKLLASKGAVPTAAKPAAAEPEKLTVKPKPIPVGYHGTLADKGFKQFNKPEDHPQGAVLYTNKEAGLSVKLTPPGIGEGPSDTKYSVYNQSGAELTSGKGYFDLVNQLNSIVPTATAAPTEPTPAEPAPTEPAPTPATKPGKAVTAGMHKVLTSKGFSVGYVSKLSGTTKYTLPDGSKVIVKPPYPGDIMSNWDYTDATGEEKSGQGNYDLMATLGMIEPTKPEPTKAPPKAAEPAKPPEPPKAAPLPEGFEKATTPGTIVPSHYQTSLADMGFEVTAVKPSNNSTIYTHANGASVTFTPPDPGHTSPYWAYTDKTGKEQTGKGHSSLVAALEKDAPPAQISPVFGKALKAEGFADPIPGFSEPGEQIYTKPDGTTVSIKPPKSKYDTTKWMLQFPKKGKGSGYTLEGDNINQLKQALAGGGKLIGLTPGHSEISSDRYWKLHEASPEPNTTELSGIKAYTGGAYREINQKMRKGLPPPEGYRDTVKAFTHYLNKCSWPEDGTIVTHWVSDTYANELRADLKKGLVFADNGFCSTDHWSGSLSIKIIVPKGAKCAALEKWTSSKSEMEITFKPRSRFIVEEYQPGSNFMLVRYLLPDDPDYEAL